MSLFGNYKRPIKPQTQVKPNPFSKLSTINLCRSTFLLGVGDEPVDTINR